MKNVRLLHALALAVALLGSGCAKPAADSHAGHDHAAGESHAADTGATAHAAGEAGAGGTDLLMCGEHGVLEAMCTKCSPGLVPAFQAKGDWCAEHGLPESVCPTCHPERGGRPLDEAALPDDAPLDRSVLQFRTLQSARDAGLQLATVERGRAPAGVIATATIVADASHHALVHASAPGVVRAISADVGTRVAAGAPLARIESASVAEARALLRAARARYDASRAAFARESTLHRSDLASAQDELAARQELESARGAVAAASATLEMHGAADQGGGSYFVRSPISGVVTLRQAQLGVMADTESPLFEVTDANALWAEIEVPETQAAFVRAGQSVTLRVRGARREAAARVEFVSPAVEPHTRTVRVRARLLDAGEATGVRPNAWAEAAIRTDGGERTVLVPRDAIQDVRGTKLAFVRLAEDRFEVRRIETGPSEDGLVAVHRGLVGGEQVVTTGSFLLKTETLKESIGAGCCDVEAPKGR